MPRILQDILMICGAVFLFIAALCLIVCIVVSIQDSIYIYRDKKYGSCPVTGKTCDAGGERIHSGQVIKCFSCIHYREAQADRDLDYLIFHSINRKEGKDGKDKT